MDRKVSIMHVLNFRAEFIVDQKPTTLSRLLQNKMMNQTSHAAGGGGGGRERERISAHKDIGNLLRSARGRGIDLAHRMSPEG